MARLRDGADHCVKPAISSHDPNSTGHIHCTCCDGAIYTLSYLTNAPSRGGVWEKDDRDGGQPYLGAATLGQLAEGVRAQQLADSCRRRIVSHARYCTLNATKSYDKRLDRQITESRSESVETCLSSLPTRCTNRQTNTRDHTRQVTRQRCIAAVQEIMNAPRKGSRNRMCT